MSDRLVAEQGNGLNGLRGGRAVRARKFIRADLKLCNDDPRSWAVGETVTVDGPIVACQRGLHASFKALDALQHASAERVRLALVECGGEIVSDRDKIACSSMTVIAIASEADTQRELRLFACRCAREALKLVKEPDPRSVAAVEVSERYARGEATAKELAAAWAAASDAAWAAASDAARAAAWAAVWAAARDAAWAAAWAAARDAAWDAARAAARDAAWDAARDAAWDAARDAVWAAARDAVWDAAWAAARDAARDAVWDAAWDAARDAQERDLAATFKRITGGEA